MVIMNITVAHGEITRTYRQIHQSVPVLFHWLILAVHVTVVHPDMMGTSCCDTIRISMMDDEVTDDNVLFPFDIQSDTCQLCTFHTYNRLVTAHLDNILLAVKTIAFHTSFYNNDIRFGGDGVMRQLLTGVYPDNLTTHSSCDAVDTLIRIDESHRTILCHDCSRHECKE